MVKYKIAIDNGHGRETAGKRTPKFSDGTQMREWEFNYITAKYLKTELERCGFETIMLSDTEIDTPLSNRTYKANKEKVDLVISIHANALTEAKFGTHGGTELHVYKQGNKAEKYAKNMLNHIISNSCKGFRNRGVKYTNLYMVRETNAPSVLCEALFMDNLEEAKKLKSDSFRKQYAIDVCKGVCDTLSVKYVGEPQNRNESVSVPSGETTYYRVIAGSYTDRKNAENMKEQLTKLGIPSFLEVFKK